MARLRNPRTGDIAVVQGPVEAMLLRRGWTSTAPAPAAPAAAPPELDEPVLVENPQTPYTFTSDETSEVWEYGEPTSEDTPGSDES